MKIYILLIAFLFQISVASTQITLDNASFEGTKQDATTPTGWHPCALGTTPDIMPGFWGVKLEAYEGDSYLGLITRDDGTWESVGQRVSEPLEAGDCYSFDLMLANSKSYAGYDKAIKLRIWGGKNSCTKDQLLGETGFVSHTEWKKYKFKFLPDSEINYIIFEAQHMDGVYFHYRGNILIDNCSSIDLCDRA